MKIVRNFSQRFLISLMLGLWAFRRPGAHRPMSLKLRPSLRWRRCRQKTLRKDFTAFHCHCNHTFHIIQHGVFIYNVFFSIRIKAELISTQGPNLQNVTFGPVELRIGRTIINGRKNKTLIYFLCRRSFSFGLLHNWRISIANQDWRRNTFWWGCTI